MGAGHVKCAGVDKKCRAEDPGSAMPCLPATPVLPNTLLEPGSAACWDVKIPRVLLSFTVWQLLPCWMWEPVERLWDIIQGNPLVFDLSERWPWEDQCKICWRKYGFPWQAPQGPSLGAPAALPAPAQYGGGWVGWCVCAKIMAVHQCIDNCGVHCRLVDAWMDGFTK